MEHLDSFGKAVRDFLRVLQEDAGFTGQALKEVADNIFRALANYRNNEGGMENFLLVRCFVPAVDESLRDGHEGN